MCWLEREGRREVVLKKKQQQNRYWMNEKDREEEEGGGSLYSLLVKLARAHELARSILKIPTFIYKNI